jgi:hypothetical protein
MRNTDHDKPIESNETGDAIAFGDLGRGENGEPLCVCCGGETIIVVQLFPENENVFGEPYWECKDCGTTWP